MVWSVSIFFTLILQLHNYVQQGFDFFGNPEPLAYILNKDESNRVTTGNPQGWQANYHNQPIPENHLQPPPVQNYNSDSIGTTTPAPPSSMNSFVVPGLDGTECLDLYSACPEFAENDYCVQYRGQMMIQCRKSCNFCDLDPYEEETESSEDQSGSGQDYGSGYYDETSSDESKVNVSEKLSLKQAKKSGKKSNKRNDIPDDIEEESTDSANSAISSLNRIGNIPIENQNLKRIVNSIQRRFKIPGALAYSEDIYAETGINPLSPEPWSDFVTRKQVAGGNVKKSAIMERSSDPYQYVKNMDKVASMFPLSDDTLASLSLSSRSYPVSIFKQPGDEEAVSQFIKNAKRNKIPKGSQEKKSKSPVSDDVNRN